MTIENRCRGGARSSEIVGMADHSGRKSPARRRWQMFRVFVVDIERNWLVVVVVVSRIAAQMSKKPEEKMVARVRKGKEKKWGNQESIASGQIQESKPKSKMRNQERRPRNTYSFSKPNRTKKELVVNNHELEIGKKNWNQKKKKEWPIDLCFDFFESEKEKKIEK